MNVGKECKVIVECLVAYDNESLAGFLRFFLMGKIQDANDKLFQRRNNLRIPKELFEC